MSYWATFKHRRYPPIGAVRQTHAKMSMNEPASPPTHSNSSKVPRAMIHKKILDMAKSKPSASMQAIAEDVSGASVDLVEKVFEEYGDPVERAAQTDGGSATPSANTADPSPESNPETATEHPEPTSVREPDQLTEKQRETLRAIYKNPKATQAKLGERLNVSDATICQRLQSIEGFEWETRDEFVTTMYENGEMTLEEQVEASRAGPDLTERVDDLSQQIGELEHQFETHDQPSMAGVNDPELAHKILHACLQAENITEDEELKILKAMIG